jgi:glycosyltransferase involved in cell wall biosynthesis
VPALSCVVPTRDRNALLRQALASVAVLAGDDLDIEIIVVDTCPSGSGAAVAREFGVRLISLPGAGAAEARNAGMAAATGEHLLFLDDDDVVLPAHVRPQVALLTRRPELAGVFGQVQLVDADLRNADEPYPLAAEVGDPFQHLLARCQQIGSLVVRTSVRETVGPQDERLPAGEEWDWTLRLALRHEVAFIDVPCLLFRQRPPGTGDRLNWSRLRYVRRVFLMNARRAGGRRPPLPALALMFARHNGLSASHLLLGAGAHVEAGDRAAGRFAFRAAVLSSPAHTVWLLARRPRLLRLMLLAHLPAALSSPQPRPR